MKNLKIIILLLVLSVLFITNCRRSGYTYCTFDKDLLAWIPQEAGDYIKYYNNNNDSLVFVVDERYIPPKDSFPNDCDCVCETLIAKFTTTEISSGQSVNTLNAIETHPNLLTNYLYF